MMSLSSKGDEEEKKTRVANAVPKSWLEKTAKTNDDDDAGKCLLRCYASHLEIENKSPTAVPRPPSF